MFLQSPRRIGTGGGFFCAYRKISWIEIFSPSTISPELSGQCQTRGPSGLTSLGTPVSLRASTMSAVDRCLCS